MEAEKEAQKTADAAVRRARIAEDTQTKIFEHPLSWYKLKDDLLSIAGALKISTQGTNGKDMNGKDLYVHIKEHLDAHPELKDNPRFMGLFSTTSRCRNVQPTVFSQNHPAMEPSPSFHVTNTPNPDNFFIHNDIYRPSGHYFQAEGSRYHPYSLPTSSYPYLSRYDLA